jgi:hypothetical protein
MSIADRLREKVLDLFNKKAPKDQKAEEHEKPKGHEETEETEGTPKPVSSTSQPSKNDLEKVLQELPEDTYQEILSHGGNLLSSIQGEEAPRPKDHKRGSKDLEHDHDHEH